jgi:NAD(P)-dependent dehydrogenase (short-subunit alcohol dehydrogenase family)
MAAERVLITGTTSGVGRALLEHYAEGGARIVAVNRRQDPELETRYPSVRFERVDVRDPDAVQRLVERLAEAGEAPDLFILNAGINCVDNDESFDVDAYKAVLDTNLFGVLHFVGPLTRLPPGSRPRHVVAISSMANYVGNPYGLGYYTSKRALTASFEVWAKMYVGTDLVFQQVMLGPVPTAIQTMHDRFPDWMVRIKDSFSGSPEGTARAVSRFALTRRRKLFYPWQSVPLYLGMWIGQRLVPGFFQGRTTLGGSRRRASEFRRDTEERQFDPRDRVERDRATHEQG